ncbi:hypothetical protein F53441_4284 [Fusarium austroafricanum]|uniref:Uncharacterized protein n=1 Tax=Fusarium austroafricanum TaxID=2364996 RepID=A0A8H4KNT0_9HYPO|nr:hypothetical protein F53441_4284 [Fusarium austroafricanum]
MEASEAASRPASEPSIPNLPLDIIHNIGLVLASEDLEASESQINNNCDCYVDPKGGSPLYKLTYLSKATKEILEPLLYRHVTLSNPERVTNTFITLIQRPELRQHVKYICCFARLSGPAIRKRVLPSCKAIWAKRCPSDKPALMRLLDGAGLHKLAWSACMLERTKQRFMFSPDFKHDGILELMLASIIFMSTNATTFIWRDCNNNPKAFILDTIMCDAVHDGLPLMPNLQRLSTEKAEFDTSKQAQFFTPHINLWDNLYKLHLNDIDLDMEFVQMLCNGSFKENRPVRELYIHCVQGSERPEDFTSFPPGFILDSSRLLNQLNHDHDKDKFKAFPNLTLLDVKFVFHRARSEIGSLTLKAFLHAVGCPERLCLTSHPLPTMTLDTGVIHSKLKYLKVRELHPKAPAKVTSKDNLVAGLNSFWSNKSKTVPNLREIDWDHYHFKREDMEGEDKAVWSLVGEEDWEDDSESDDEDFDDDHIEEMREMGFVDPEELSAYMEAFYPF